ncbi:MAG: hypothetical protein Q4B70_18325 [Lachnospiraceae bacterium]|nr:hypothetical protein [Lachnospiraceae bacterium]
MEETREKLYTPSYVKAEAEYFPGFGKKELRLSLLMSSFVVGIGMILWVITGDLAMVVLAVLIGVAGTIIVNTKNAANLSMVTFVVLMIYFLKEQQRFLYHYMDEWS